MVVQELERRAEPPLVHELHDAVEFFELVLQRRAGEHHGVAAPEFLHLAARSSTSQFLMRWASSSTITSGFQALIASRSRTTCS